ncbi:MAG TPA: hypothetical protein VEZ12_21620 [Herpetosiphonaceae bacterium]|nr:hypothetical protein [Herpetosiphonaceae bacterium]
MSHDSDVDPSENEVELKNSGWNQSLYDAEFFYCLGLGLMTVTDDLESDYTRIMRDNPKIFPGSKGADGKILYDEDAAFAFVSSECPHIPLEYRQAWLRAWDKHLR